MKYNWKKYVVIFEVEGGSDKWPDGHRRDTMPILEWIKKQGFDWEVIFYDENKKDEIYDYVSKKAGVVIPRVNPGNLKSVDDFFVFLNKLSKNGILVNTHPDVMINLNFKDILVKLSNTNLCYDDSYFYHTFEEFKKQFKKNLEKYKFRVLKKNYGSTGEGVWIVELLEDGRLKAIEAVNNEKKKFDSIEEFENFLKDYFEDDKDEVYFKWKSGFVDVRFLPRITEWEIRVVIIWEEPKLVVHKKPAEWEFSATLFSWAKYNSDSVDNPKWKEVVEITKNAMNDIKEYIWNREYPLIWTLDYILDYDENWKDKYVLSEINCSCVWITTDLQLADEIGKKIKEMFEK